MSDLPLVSILIPAYNHEKYVQECIKSIINQDYPRIELIVIDDGSRDATWTRINEMRVECEKRFVRFVARHQENKGAAETSRRLQELAEGEFVGPIASDDQFLPGAVWSLIKPMLDDKDVGLVVGVNEIMDSDGRTCYWNDKSDNVYSKSEASCLTFSERVSKMRNVDLYGTKFGDYQELLRGNHVPNGYIFRKSCYNKIEYLIKGLVGRPLVLEDWWLHLQLSKVAKYKAIHAHTFRYRWHNANSVKNGEIINRMCRETLFRELENVLTLRDQQWKRFARHELRILVVIKELFWRIRIWAWETVDGRWIRVGCTRFSIPFWWQKPITRR